MPNEGGFLIKGLAAGTFLYAPLSKILPGEFNVSKQIHRAMLSAAAGLLLMVVVALYA